MDFLADQLLYYNFRHYKELGMASVAERLRDERRRRGLRIETIADDLRISARYLSAMEAGEWEQLPEGFVGRAFVRQYARVLGLDASEIEDALSGLRKAPEVKIETVVLQRATIHVPPMPVPLKRKHSIERWLLSVAALVAVVWGCSFLYAGWQKWRTVDTLARTEEVAKPPAAPAAPAPTVPVPVMANVASDTLADGSMLEIAAAEATWVEVTVEGRRVFSGVLEPGQVRRFPSAQARLLIGNAGGVSVRRKGQDIGPIGPRGQVRVVKLSDESYEIEMPRRPQSD